VRRKSIDKRGIAAVFRGMAKLNAVQRAERVVTFLMGLRNPKIATAMASRGFRTEDLDEGFALLRKVTPSLIAPLPPGGLDETPMDAIARWSRTWLPIASIALRRRAPELATRLLDELEAVPTLAVPTFLDRLDALDQPKRKGAMSAMGIEARSLLASRGLTAEVLAEGRRTVDRVLLYAPVANPNDWSSTAFERADAELWSYYLEWSLVARLAIKERRLLRQLGFRQTTAGEKDEEG